MTIEKKNCDECIFKRYTFDKDGKGTIPICHGKYRSRHEAIVAISEDTCDMYNRGHELYETRKVDGINVDDLPPSKEYLTDPMDFSKEPVAICDHIRIGIDPCWRRVRRSSNKKQDTDKYTIRSGNDINGNTRGVLSI